MKERPILFSGAMVRALLAGTKTQTRRVIKPQPFQLPLRGGVAGWNWTTPKAAMARWTDQDRFAHELARFAPYGQPGDRLWVRETCRAKELESGPDGVFYIADEAFQVIENTREAADAWCALNAYRGRRGATVPPIHMPRWASRLLLEITEVRVQRLQDISHEDAEQEGVKCDMSPLGFREHFAALWDRINGAGAWNANPWVWAVSFKREESTQ